MDGGKKGNKEGRCRNYSNQHLFVPLFPTKGYVRVATLPPPSSEEALMGVLRPPGGEPPLRHEVTYALKSRQVMIGDGGDAVPGVVAHTTVGMGEIGEK